jgi:hypothetical protein
MKEAMQQVIESKMQRNLHRYETMEELDEALGITATKG